MKLYENVKSVLSIYIDDVMFNDVLDIETGDLLPLF